MSNTHGEIKEFEDGVMWEVPHFDLLPPVSDYFVDSPKFQLSGGTWCVRLFPSQDERNTRYVVFWLLKVTSSPQNQKYYCSVRYADEEGSEYYLVAVTKGLVEGIKLSESVFFGSIFRMCSNHIIKHTNGSIKVICRVFPIGLSSEATSLIATQHSASQTVWPTPAVPEQPSCGKETPKESPGVEKLLLDLKKLLKSGAESDLLVVVSGREFRVHKNILRVRSAVFDAMFEHDTVEKESGKVAIEDLDPDAFRDFLEYMYTGRVEVFSDENVFGLYAAADKYDVRELKSEALEYMQRTLSLETFCDVMSLVLLHRENDLMEHAIDFFKKNLSKIIVTVQWQTFMRDHGTAANELLVKAFVPAEKK